ncbi:CDP-diacylglycerol--glycerol-3-phosphate 3-phosphatidyltransferase [soil metagenome]
MATPLSKPQKGESDARRTVKASPAVLSLLNQITYVRILLIPIVMGLILLGDNVRYAYGTAVTLFIAASVTDWLDGWLARRWSETTTLGSFLDTTADKLLVSGVLIALVAVDRASPWIALLIIGRELIVLGLRGAVAADGGHVKPSIWGKLKANVQFVAIGLAIVRWPITIGPLYLDEWIMLAAAAITVMSAVEYFTRFYGALTSPDPRR